jgi:RNA polymerase sigma-70 factor (ECF subfamily)
MTPSFTEQLSRSRNGDRAALEVLFARWRPLLSLQARQLLGAELSARLDPADVVQETMLQAFHDLDQFRGQTEAEWVAWLRVLLAGHAAKLMRHHHADKRDPARETAPADYALAAPESMPTRQFLEPEQALRLASAIEALPSAMREVVVRRVFQREPFETLAASLGKTPGATRVLWSRALKQLRELLDRNEP